jgi:hypothetical protein
MLENCNELITKFGYGHLFSSQKENIGTKDIDSYNMVSLKKSIFETNEAEEVTSIMINFPALLLRKKTQLYPQGRTSYRFKRELRKLVTIIGKSAFNWEAAKGKTPMKKAITFTE